MKRISLEEVHSSIDTTLKKGYWRRLLAFLGPAYLISVGYMDPGNWATDIAGGSQFGYKLLWVLLMSNVMALLLQSLSARLGLVRGLDLAQASKSTYPKFVNFSLYVLAEIAIAACDLAEVLGMAIGLNLLFDIPLLWAVLITVLDTFLLLFLINKGMRALEAFILALISIIGFAFLLEMIMAKPDTVELAKGFLPHLPEGSALYIAIGIIGATVMPHNLYLHSSLVQTRKFSRAGKGLWEAIKFNFIDSAIALNLAFFVNAAILVLAASTFYQSGMFHVSQIQDAYKFLEPLLGTKWAGALFAIALIAAGQSSTITGTLAGQIVMEGYLDIRIQPWIRRVITRLIAITPAVIAIVYFGEGAIGELLVLSQVVLSLQLGFAIIPLIHFVSSKQKMGEYAIKNIMKSFSWFIAIVIVGLNAKLVYEEINRWLETFYNPTILWFTVVPIAIGAAGLLLYITIFPALSKKYRKADYLTHGAVRDLAVLPIKEYRHIAVALDFSGIDNLVINRALTTGGKNAIYYLIHIVESAGAILYGNEIEDQETEHDFGVLKSYAAFLEENGYKAEIKLEFGSPKKKIPEYVNSVGAELLVMGAHGHRFFKDILLGTTVDNVRHKVNMPILIVGN
jgi:manganese transport protein